MIRSISVLTDQERMSIEMACIEVGDYETADWLIGQVEAGNISYLGTRGKEHAFALTINGLIRSLWDPPNDLLRRMFITQLRNSLTQLGVPEWLPTTPHNT